MTIVKLVFLVIGTVLTAAYLLLTKKGAQYDYLLENLPDEGFSDKELLAAGYALQNYSLFSMESGMGQQMMAQARLLYPQNECRYAEYWARLYWARTLSMTWLVAAMVFSAAAMMQGIMVVLTPVAGLIAAYAMYDEGANAMKKQLKKRSEDCLLEFSNVVSKLAMLMSCSLTLPDAWDQVAFSKKGPIYDLMQVASHSMHNGVTDTMALYQFGIQSDTPEIRKLTSVLIQSMLQGVGVGPLLMQQSEELWDHKRQLMLQKGDEAAAKLLLPTMLMLVGILAIIIVSAVSGLSLTL